MKIRNLIQKEFKIANQPPPKDKADYKAKMSTIQDLQKNPKLRDPESQANICLLYTSPSPRDRQKSRMPSSA